MNSILQYMIFILIILTCNEGYSSDQNRLKVILEEYRPNVVREGQLCLKLSVEIQGKVEFNLADLANNLVLQTFDEDDSELYLKYRISILYHSKYEIRYLVLLDNNTKYTGPIKVLSKATNESKLPLFFHWRISKERLVQHEFVYDQEYHVKALINSSNFVYADAILSSISSFSTDLQINQISPSYTLFCDRLHLIAARDGVKAAYEEGQRLQLIKWGFYAYPVKGKTEIDKSTALLKSLKKIIESNENAKLSPEEWNTIEVQADKG